MTFEPIKRTFTALNSSFRHPFWRDERGVNSIEFAIVSPFMLTLWLMMVAAVDMENSSTEVGRITGTVSDIVSQSPVVNGESIECTLDASQAMLSALSLTKFQVYIAGVEVTQDDGVIVRWARGRNNTDLNVPAKDSAYQGLPSYLESTPGYYVITKGRLKHTPLYAQVMMADGNTEKKYDYTSYFVPRHSFTTDCEDCDQSVGVTCQK